MVFCAVCVVIDYFDTFFIRISFKKIVLKCTRCCAGFESSFSFQGLFRASLIYKDGAADERKQSGVPSSFQKIGIKGEVATSSCRLSFCHTIPFKYYCDLKFVLIFAMKVLVLSAESL